MNAWCGHTSGYISIYDVGVSSITQLAVVNHYDPVFDGLEVSRLVSSSVSGRYVWSYVYPGKIRQDLWLIPLFNRIRSSRLHFVPMGRFRKSDRGQVGLFENRSLLREHQYDQYRGETQS